MFALVFRCMVHVLFMNSSTQRFGVFFVIWMFYCKRILNVRNKDDLLNQKNLYLMFYSSCHKLLIIYTHTYYKSCCCIFAAKKKIKKLDFFFFLCSLSFDLGYLSVQLINQTLDKFQCYCDPGWQPQSPSSGHCHQVFFFFFSPNKSGQLFPLNAMYFKW